MIQDVWTFKQKRCPYISKNDSIFESWKFIGPIVASRFGGSEFIPVPYLFDADAYRIGHVFVPAVTTKTGCFGSRTKCRLIGRIGNFLNKSESNPAWCEENLPVLRSSTECQGLKIKLGSGDRKIVFIANGCYYLSKPENMVATRAVTIDRYSHEDLMNAKWIGMITEVVASDVFQMKITAKLRNRTLYVGNTDTHALLFKYEIWKLDETGNVSETESMVEKKISNIRWEPVDKIKRDRLPMSSLN